MKKALIKFCVLAAVFIACLCIFYKILNPETADLTTEMSEASLPVITVEQDGLPVNELHGYTGEMEAETVPDCITPFSEDNTIRLKISYADHAADTISYEVRSADGSRLIEENEAELSAAEDGSTVTLTLKDLLSDDTEYLLILTLESDGDPVYYYAKILREGSSRIMEVVSFANEFHEAAMDEEAYEDLSVYLEPDSSADNSTLQTVTINNSLSQVAWGDLAVQDVTAPVCYVQEMSEDTSTVVLRSLLTSEDEDGVVSYYNVEETFYVRPGEERMYLLDYERVVEEIFTGESSSISDEAVTLGICAEDVDYESNSTGTGVCFVQEGELWSYQQDTGQLVCVFSFRGEDSSISDPRENYGNHEIVITDTDETGSIDFIVYGYMSSGEHEGEVGICVCRYDQTTNTVEEYLFLSASVSVSELSESIGLMYMGDNGKFYIQINEELVSYDIETLESETTADLSGGKYRYSESGRYLAWTKESSADVMYLLDLSDETVWEIAAEENASVRPFGFMEEDCIYGYVSSDGGEDTASAAYKIEIAEVSEDGVEVLTTYEKSGYLVQKVTVEDETITLKLISENGKKKSSDTIINKEMEESTAAASQTVDSNEKQAVIRLVFPESEEITKVIIKTPSLILPEEEAEVHLSSELFLQEE